MRTWVAISAGAALVVPIVGWSVAQHRQPPGYDPMRQTISALAARGVPDRWIMTLGLFVLGLAHLLTAVGLPEIGPPARGLFAVGGIATMAVAALPQPAIGHLIAAGIAFLALAGWPLFADVPDRNARWLATAILLALLIWFGTELRGGPLLGFSERILATAEAVWPIIVILTVRFSAPRPLSTARGRQE